VGFNEQKENIAIGCCGDVQTKCTGVTETVDTNLQIHTHTHRNVTQSMFSECLQLKQHKTHNNL